MSIEAALEDLRDFSELGYEYVRAWYFIHRLLESGEVTLDALNVTPLEWGMFTSYALVAQARNLHHHLTQERFYTLPVLTEPVATVAALLAMGYDVTPDDVKMIHRLARRMPDLPPTIKAQVLQRLPARFNNTILHAICEALDDDGRVSVGTVLQLLRQQPGHKRTSRTSHLRFLNRLLSRLNEASDADVIASIRGANSAGDYRQVVFSLKV